MPTLNIEFPAKLQCLFWDTVDGRMGGKSPIRYRVLYGGRGGGKSWAIADALLIRGMGKPLRILCARELQNSIDDSVHALLKNRIDALGLTEEYIVFKDYVLGKNGTTFRFEGIRHNINRIRSYEAIDICWVEEAVKVSRSSWEVLVPTIRKAGSEIWLSFNPELESDYIYQEFVKNPPDDAVVVMVNWRDNPWFDKSTMPAERDRLRKRDLDAYLNVWEGQCREILEGAIYGQEMREAKEEKRLDTPVAYNATYPVDVFFDVGYNDMTAIWFAQIVGPQAYILDYYQNNQKHIPHYVNYLQRKPYNYGTIWLPHDAKAKKFGQEHSAEEQLRSHFRVRIVPNISIIDGINAARTIFPSCWFDPQKCEVGLQALRQYRFEVDPDTKVFSDKPFHDKLWSHGADAFRYLALCLKAPREKVDVLAKVKEKALNMISSFNSDLPSNTSWMR